MDFFNDTRVRSAETRHSKRRRRTGAVFDSLNSVFHLALLLFAIALIAKFAQIALPELLDL